MDRLNPKKKERWAAFAIVLGVFLLRVYIKSGYAVIAYLLGLYYLNNLMLFLAPADDFEDMAYNEFELPTRETDEYKGFQRKMQEMETWQNLFTATTFAAFFSLFDSMDIEIYWPLLLTYFCMMTCFLFRFKIEHMIRYKYIPMELGKKKYEKHVELPDF